MHPANSGQIIHYILTDKKKKKSRTKNLQSIITKQKQNDRKQNQNRNLF